MGLRRFLVPAVVVMFAGCRSTLHWSKSGGTAPDFNRDSYECATQTTQTERRAGLGGGSGFYREGTTVNKDLYRACMTARGYSRNDPKGWQGLRD